MSQSRFYVICFDVSDEKRLRKVAIQMENFGMRVQYSVFECYLDATELETLKQRLLEIIDQDNDHVRYYGLCNKDVPKIVLDGLGMLTRDADYHLL